MWSQGLAGPTNRRSLINITSEKDTNLCDLGISFGADAEESEWLIHEECFSAKMPHVCCNTLCALHVEHRVCLYINNNCQQYWVISKLLSNNCIIHIFRKNHRPVPLGLLQQESAKKIIPSCVSDRGFRIGPLCVHACVWVFVWVGPLRQSQRQWSSKYRGIGLRHWVYFYRFLLLCSQG